MSDENSPTHTALVKKYYGAKRKLFTWLEVGKGRLDKNGNFHGLLDRLPIGGFSGYICYVPIGKEPPEPEPDHPNNAVAEGDES